MRLLATAAILSLVATVAAQAEDLNRAFETLNKARLANGVKPLSWSPDLAAYAQLWANMMASGQVPFEHASGPYRPEQGEVLYVQEAGQCDVSYDIPFQSAMKAWLSQASLYDGNPIATGHEPWLHWSQCMWSGSEDVGCARAYSISKAFKIFVVCRFGPEGNVVGQKPF